MKSFVPMLVIAVVTLAGCAGDHASRPSMLEDGSFAAAVAENPGVFPSIIPLPDGFQPEGIATGRGTTFYVGSLADGSIYQGDLRTGAGAVLVPPTGGVSVGLTFDPRRDHLFAAGGSGGTASVFNATTGALLAVYELAPSGTAFINDVVVTRSGAYFTDSFQPVYYRIPLSPNGALPDPPAVEAIPLSGDFVFVPGEFNANGIAVTPNGKWLILVNSATGELYRVEPGTGEAVLIDLGGETVLRGDGILLDGRDLYVVQNFLNQISVVRLDSDFASGEVTRVIVDPNFRIPATVAEFGAALYVVNARFDVPPTPETEYEVVRVLKR